MPGLKAPGRFIFEDIVMDYYDKKLKEHEEMLGCGCIVTAVLLIVGVGIYVVQMISGWL